MSYNEIVYPYIEGEPKNVIIDVKEIKAFLKLPLEPDEYLDMELVDMSATALDYAENIADRYLWREILLQIVYSGGSLGMGR